MPSSIVPKQPHPKTRGKPGELPPLAHALEGLAWALLYGGLLSLLGWGLLLRWLLL